MSILRNHYQWILAIILGAAIGPLLTQPIGKNNAPSPATADTSHASLTSKEEKRVQELLTQLQQKVGDKKIDIRNIIKEPEMRGLSIPARERVIFELTKKNKDGDTTSGEYVTAAK